MSHYHEPVLLNESIEGLAIKEDGIYVDATYGGGGHAAEILRRIGKNGKLFAFDRDKDSLLNILEDKRLVMINHNYKFLKKYLKYYKALPVNGIIADLGISSYQIDTADRGFSTRFEGDLDLRMDRRKRLTGAYVINHYEQHRLTKILREFCELENAGLVSAAIVRARQEKLFRTTFDVKNALQDLIPKGNESKFLARVFQGLRIEVNDELEALRELLLQSIEVLVKGGRLVVITYHSLEDRLVKCFMRSGDFGGTGYKDPIFGNVEAPLKTINRKVITAGDDEINANNRARSARLRIAEKL